MSKGDVYRIGAVHEYVEQYTKDCSGCGAKMAMAIDAGGKWHPFDPETGVSHYSTCPTADMFRTKRQ